MSRSRKKTPKQTIVCCNSEKLWKRYMNRRVRRGATQRLLTDGDGDNIPDLKTLYDPWSGPKDGKRRFDPDEHPEDMRK